MTEQQARRTSPGKTDSARGDLFACGHISIEGFKSVGALEKLRLSPLNVLIGANGSGKSNFHEVFERAF